MGLPDRVVKRIKEVLKILLHRLIDHLWCPKAAHRVCRRDAGMKGADLVGQDVNVRGVQRARLDKMAEQGVLGKLRHLHGVLNGCPGPCQRGRSGVPYSATTSR